VSLPPPGAAAEEEATREAIARGLTWLALHQAADGHWGLHNFSLTFRDKPRSGGKVLPCDCDSGVNRNDDIAGTAFGILPFLGAGITHKSGSKKGDIDYSATVRDGLNYLQRKQDRNGSFGTSLYAQALAALAVCEAYRLTADSSLKPAAQKAVDFICYAQNLTDGGWRYAPKQAGDLSVTGFHLTALKSAQHAGLDVPPATLRRVGAFLDASESKDRGGYAYMPGMGESQTMTAVGLLCRLYLGADPQDPGIRAGLARLNGYSPGGANSSYLDFYVTRLMHKVGDEDWERWDRGRDGKGGLRAVLLTAQEHNAAAPTHAEGSWGPQLAGDGGRMMATSFSLLCLEVPYGHLLLFRREGSSPGK
jgi:hypothetical protein